MRIADAQIQSASTQSPAALTGPTNANSPTVAKTARIQPSTVASYAFGPTYTPNQCYASFTFGSDGKPKYNPDQPANIASNNGQEAANGVLRMEQVGIGGTNDNTPLIAQLVTQHQNDPKYLQQFFGALGVSRTAKALREMTSLGYVQNPYSGLQGVPSSRVSQQMTGVANALSALVASGDFTPGDMDTLVAQFAKDSPQNNFSFVKSVLAQASPQVNQMFYQSALNYALANPNSSQGNAMAAYAAQALSQTPITQQLDTLNQLQSAGKLTGFVQQAMRGEAQYGNPPQLQDYAKTGRYGLDDGQQGDPLNGLPTLISNAAYYGGSSLQTQLFQSSVGELGSDSNVKSFYDGNVAMKEALGSTFQNDYTDLTKTYSNGRDLTDSGLTTLPEFFKNVLFTPPLGANASATAKFFTGKLSEFVNDENTLTDQAFQAKYGSNKSDYAQLMGEQAETFSTALSQQLASLAGDSGGSQDVIGAILSVGEAGVSVLGPEATIGGAIVGEALKLLVSGSNGSSDLNKVVKNLEAHGIDVSQYLGGSQRDIARQIHNQQIEAAFLNGWTFVKG
jgi:hypothetical protein